MFRGTTPTLTYHIKSEVDLTTITEIWLTIADFSTEETFKLSDDEVSVDPDEMTISIHLSQEHTLAFEDDSTVEIQMRVLDNADLAYVTEITEVEMKRILKSGVISSPSSEDSSVESGDDTDGSD